ncbi:MAG: adenylate/guanylate cyclase domain-containing protein [Gallionella sp.]
MNNYISLGLLPRPLVKNPEPGAQTSARQIGYFPQEVLSRLDRINQLKKEGYAMANMAVQLQKDGFPALEKIAVQQTSTASSTPYTAASEPFGSADIKVPQIVNAAKSDALRLTIDHIPYPAYMVNYKFEITWLNEEARTELFDSFDHLPADIKDRNALSYLINGRLGRNGANREELLQFYLLLGKGRFSRDDLMNILSGKAGIPTGNAEEALAQVYPNGTLMQLPLTLCLENGEIVHYNVYASYYREGILFIHLPGHADSESLLGILERRDEVIRSLLKKHLPVLTDVAVLVADLQSSVRICSELPPEEYFELINQIWATMEPIFRKYYGTHGKHVGDGMVYYFFPQPDCNYISNALMCAKEMKAAMLNISKEWQMRKNWMNALCLNIGLNEGYDWLGIFQNETKVEFTVLGDTINHATRLSEFARDGAIWATKNLLGKLPAIKRQRIKFGIRRQNADGHEIFISEFYSRVSELTNLNAAVNNKIMHDIATLPVTEIMEVEV